MSSSRDSSTSERSDRSENRGSRVVRLMKTKPWVAKARAVARRASRRPPPEGSHGPIVPVTRRGRWGRMRRAVPGSGQDSEVAMARTGQQLRVRAAKAMAQNQRASVRTATQRKSGWGDRLRYMFDNSMTRGTPALIGWLTLATVKS